MNGQFQSLKVGYKLLDKWLTKKTEDGESWWNTLKKEAPAPTVKNFRLYLEHVAWLRKYHEALPVQTVYERRAEK